MASANSRMDAMYQKILHFYLLRFVQNGNLTIHYPNGQIGHYSGNAGVSVAIRLHPSFSWRRFLLDPGMATGEAYMDGSLTIETGTLQDFLKLIVQNRVPRLHNSRAAGALNCFLRLAMRLRDANRLGAAKNNIAHHYDLSNDFYRLFLDRDMQYSCAYFEMPDMTLEQAQEAKKEHISRKLCLKPGQRVLDIGCGWGGLAMHMVRRYEVDVTGCTLSEQQHALAVERSRDMQRKPEFLLKDYRQLKGQFDRIVSVGMFEHVGLERYPEFFASAAARLKEDGVMLLHTIVKQRPTASRNNWMRKYIFPGCFLPSIAQVAKAAESQSLWISDIECLRLHYAWTLREWYQRFLTNRQSIVARYDERFARMWEFYLAGCQEHFDSGDLMVAQIQLSKNKNAVPMTRRYLYDAH